MKTILPSLALTFFLTMTSPAKSSGTTGGNEGFYHQQEDSFPVTLLMQQEKPISAADLTILKIRFKNFTTVLEKKLSAADKSTQMLFTPVRKSVDKLLASPDTEILQSDELYREVRTIMSEIKKNPVMAMAYEESRDLSGRHCLATIHPDRGPGATYRLNEPIQFMIKALRDCFVQIFFISSSKDVQKELSLQPLTFYPEPGKETVHLAPGDTLILGEDGSFTVEPPYGNDLVIVVASEKLLQPRSTASGYPIPFPLDFEKIFADIFGKQTAEKLSIHSCFIESRP